MADAIEYTYKPQPDTVTLPGGILGGTSPSYSITLPMKIVVSPELPEDMNDISGIDLNISGQWVRVCSMNHPGVVWELLACGMPKPNDMTYSTASLFAQTIWLDTILHSDRVKGHPLTIATCFHDAMGHKIEGDLWDSGIQYRSNFIDWRSFNDIALDAGVDFRLRAWLDGVPLEHVLAE